MYKKNRLLIFIGFASLISILGYLFISKEVQTISAKTLTASQPLVSEISCYPDKVYNVPKKIDKFIFQGVTYFQTTSPFKTTAELTLLYFQTSPNGCKNLTVDEIASRETYLPKKVALHFANLYVQNIFDICLREKKNELDSKKKCNSKLESIFNVPGDLSGENPTFLYSDVAEVLNKRGIKTNKALIIKTSTDYMFATQKSRDQTFNLKKCAKFLSSETIKNISVIEIKEYPSIRSGKRIYYNVDVELSNGQTSRHVLQILLLKNGDSCDSYYVGSGIGSNSLSSNNYPQKDARSIMSAWYKWKLKNVPREKERIQQYLNSPYPTLADEEYWTFSKLGFKMPKNYKKVP